MHQVNLSDVVVDPPVIVQNAAEIENFEEADTLTNSPRRTFVIKKSNSPNSEQSRDNSDAGTTDDEGEVKQSGPNVNVFGKMPSRQNRKKINQHLEPGEVRIPPQAPKIKVENPYSVPSPQKPLKSSDGMLEKPPKKPLTNDDLLSYCTKNTEAITSIGLQRINNFDIILAQWSTGDIITTARQSMNLPSSSAFTDFLSLINDSPSVWTLELVTVVIANLANTLQMKHKEYIAVGEKTIELILKQFSSLLITNMNDIIGHLGGGIRAVDLQKEQRQERVQYVRDSLKNTIYSHLKNDKLRLQIDQIP